MAEGAQICDFMRKVEAKWRRARKSATSGSNLREAKVDAT